MTHTNNDKPIEFAPTSLDEQETLIRLCRATGLAHITSCWPGQTKRLQKKYGRPHRVSISKRDGLVTASYWDVALRCITFRGSPPKHPGNVQALKRVRRGRQKG